MVDVFDRAHVQSAGGLDGDQQVRVLIDLPGHDGLLLVAAGHAAGDGHRALAGAHVVLLDQPLGIRPDGFPLEEARPGDKLRLEIPLEHHVVLQGVVQYQAVFMPVLGDVAHAHGGPLPDGGVGDVPAPVRAILPSFTRLQAGEAVDQLGLAVAVDTGDTDDLAPP